MVGCTTVDDATRDIVERACSVAVVLGGQHAGRAGVVTRAVALGGASLDHAARDVVSIVGCTAVVLITPDAGCVVVVRRAVVLECAFWWKEGQ